MVFLSHQPSLHNSVLCTVQNSAPRGGTGDRTSAFSVVLITHSTLAPPPQTFLLCKKWWWTLIVGVLLCHTTKL